MYNKCCNYATAHSPLPAGMVNGDKSTEIFACRDTENLYAISDGHTIPFGDLDPLLRARYLKMVGDEKAFEDLKHLELDKAVEKFAFCVMARQQSRFLSFRKP